MDAPQGSTDRGTAYVPPVTDRVVGDTTSYVTRPGIAAYPQTEIGQNVLTVRNRIQWGPILGGVISAIATFLLLTVLGLALGASVLGPQNEGGEIGTWAAIWGAFSIIAAFFVGGWIAARTAAVDGSFAGLMNGILVGATGLLFIVWMTSTGLGNLFGTLSSSVGGLLNVAASVAPAAAPAVDDATGPTTGAEAGDAVEEATGINVDNPEQAAQQAQDAAAGAAAEAGEAVEQAANDPATYEAVRNGALGTFLALLLPLVAAALGGWLGKHERQELISGSGAA
jgi:hypothetical protein